MLRIVVLAIGLLVAALLPGGQLQAQSCGSPPDPRWNSSGYASWCSCMGGSYNYQTTACTGATGPRGRAPASENWGCFAEGRSGRHGNSWGFASESEARDRAMAECRSHSGSACWVRYCQRGTSAGNVPSRPQTAPPPPAGGDDVADTGNWGCWAQAGNGRGGYSWGFSTQGEAQSRALTECRAHSGQTSCTVRSCQPGTSAQLLPSKRAAARAEPRSPPGTAAAEAPGTAKTARSPEQRPQAAPAAPQYFCAVCEQKLNADLRTGLSSARPRTFVQQVVAGYENCKLKAFQPCFLGDIQARSVTNACREFTRDEDYRACLRRTLGE